MKFSIVTRILVSPIRFVALMIAAVVAVFLLLIGEEEKSDWLLETVMEYGNK